MKRKAYDVTTQKKGMPEQNRSAREIDFHKTRHIIIFTIFVTAMFFFIGTGLLSGIFYSDASVVEANQQIGEIQYKVIEIQKGDSLWSIAKENMNPGFEDIFAYIHEVKRCNQLDSDTITAGHYLMIPYYE